MDKLQVGQVVIINCNTPKYLQYNIKNQKAIIKVVYDNNYALAIKGIKNEQSQYGYFYLSDDYFDIDDKDKERIKRMNDINKYKGTYKAAAISFIDNNSNYEISYKMYEDGFNYKENDIVVVKSAHHGFGIAKIVKIFDDNSDVVIKEDREIVCPVDFSKFNERIEKAKEITKLENQMKKKVNELQGIALIELMAEKSPELAEMLNRFKELTGI